MQKRVFFFFFFESLAMAASTPDLLRQHHRQVDQVNNQANQKLNSADQEYGKKLMRWLKKGAPGSPPPAATEHRNILQKNLKEKENLERALQEQIRAAREKEMQMRAQELERQRAAQPSDGKGAPPAGAQPLGRPAAPQKGTPARKQVIVDGANTPKELQFDAGPKEDDEDAARKKKLQDAGLL